MFVHCSLYCTCVLLGHEIREVTDERAVYKYLMDGYRRSIRPAKNHSEPVVVKLDLYLYMLEDLVRLPRLARGCFNLYLHTFTVIVAVVNGHVVIFIPRLNLV